MDLKLGLGFFALSLYLLILLVGCGVEARKLISDEVVQETDVFFWIYNNNHNNNNKKSVYDSSHRHNNHIDEKQGENNRHDKKKEDAHFWIYDTQGEHKGEQEKRENAHFWIYDNYNNKRVWKYDENKHHNNHNNNKKLSWLDDKQGENNHQQVKKEDAHFWIYDKQGENNLEEAKIDNVHIHSSSHMDHLDPNLAVFFFIDDLKLGNAISVYFPRRDLSSSNPSFLPKEEADSIPFSLKELPNLLQRFSFSENSPQAKAMENTLRECEAPPIKGETKYCATSLEAMLDFTQGIMGDKVTIKALSTTHNSTSSTPPRPQKYTILDVPREVPVPKMVACHTMPYAYAIFYCHYTMSKSKVFEVSLGGENGDRVKAIAVCHLDTSEWSPHHPSFRILGILPGTSPVCHFFPSDNLVWVPTPKITAIQDI